MGLFSDRRGQLTVVGLLMIFLTILVLAVLTPAILESVGTISQNLTDDGKPVEAVIVNLVPLFILVTLLSTIALYGSPQIGGG